MMDIRNIVGAIAIAMMAGDGISLAVSNQDMSRLKDPQSGHIVYVPASRHHDAGYITLEEDRTRKGQAITFVVALVAIGVLRLTGWKVAKPK